MDPTREKVEAAAEEVLEQMIKANPYGASIIITMVDGLVYVVANGTSDSEVREVINQAREYISENAGEKYQSNAAH